MHLLVIASDFKRPKSSSVVGVSYSLPPTIFRAKPVCDLESSGCELEPPRSNVKLFIALLSLMSVGADDHVIETLVAGCPVIATTTATVLYD